MATHGHDHHTQVSHGSDKGAAFVGLFGGAILLLAVVYGIVQWTNAKYAGHAEGGERPAAEATK
jgi:hypothetical protein